ncbi:calcium/proton exchanger [Stereum hirsutum FP-91666 SS1]|uniref:calcium/proton exchanger n=1 Tax=Stereum hirsutum (strain FP-91666) TaxID=721885 RepID=UPI000440A7DF|nr:calcium/proton exchanger [Stereum hirsutum FP-91666 SS1]EIM91413.1 calcium/proton exchanger [Stereum hirsutum FP-91666 SS1]
MRRHRREKPIGAAPGIRDSLLAILKTSWLNLLLVFIPLSWAFNFAMPDSYTLVFVFSFLAIIPLAKLLAFATDELSMRVGQTLAGLLNATLGNAVELIVAILALIKCELTIVQSSLVGSILSNLLLVLGMCFFAGGTRFSEQGFGLSATQLNSSLLTLSVIAVLLPAAFHSAVTPLNRYTDPLTDAQEGKDILSISHGVAIILLFIYGCYIYFQLFSHRALYEDDHPNVLATIPYPNHVDRMKKHKKSASSRAATPVPGDREGAPSPSPTHPTHGSVPSTPNGTTTALAGPSADMKETDRQSLGRQSLGVPGSEEDEEEEKPMMSVPMTIALLAVVTVLVAVTAEWLVDSINGLVDQGGISREFVGLILLPIVGNAAEHVTAVTVSVKDKLTLSLGVAVGSSIQIALFVIPFIVTLGWMMGKPLTLLFDPFESIVLFLAVLTVNYVVQDGKSNWLEGMILMCLYVIIAVVFWFYPGSDPAGVLASCTT